MFTLNILMSKQDTQVILPVVEIHKSNKTWCERIGSCTYLETYKWKLVYDEINKEVCVHRQIGTMKCAHCGSVYYITGL